MDLSFSRPTPAADASLSADDIAMLTAVLARRETSVAVDGQAAPDQSATTDLLLAPGEGAFSATMAQRLAAWRDE